MDPRLVIPGTAIPVGAASVAALQRAMTRGDLSSATLTDFYLNRIARLNPALHAVITVNPSAAAEAAASDAHRKTRPARALEGIPVLVKDNIAVTGLPTTAGSPALLAATPDDAFLTTRLRDAGAVIIGKANLSEWANFRSSHSVSGWSTLGGQTANPFDLSRNPSGSSSGSAAGVAACLAPLAVGTETDGSIISPASVCGVVGIKPTNGLISRRGIVPISPVQDTAGPIAASVADAAALLAVLAAEDALDPVFDVSERSGVLRQLAMTGPGAAFPFLDPGAADGARLGVWRPGPDAAGPAIVAVLDAALARLRSLGAVLKDSLDPPDMGRIGEPEFAALRYEFKYGINEYLAYLADVAGFTGPATLAELIDFNKRNSDLVMSRFGQDVFEEAEATSGALDDPAYTTLRRDATAQAREALEIPLERHSLDAIVALSSGPAWLTDYVLGDHYSIATTPPAAVAGCPAITVPAGAVSGLPVGVTFMGPRWSEPRLLALAYAFEQSLLSVRPRPVPAFLNAPISF